MTISSVNGGAGTVNRYTYNATGGETTISGTDSNGATISYLVGKEEVYVNGVLLVRTADYTATNGTSVVLVNALVAGDVIEIVTFSSFAIPTAISSNTVTAKGDLIVGNGASSVTNLGVGADGTTLVANSSASTGVSWAGPLFVAGKNKIINGDFGIWQRGTSFNLSGGGTAYSYTADRWDALNISGATTTVSQQAFTPGTAPVAGYEGNYFLRYATTDTSVGHVLRQKIEDVRTFAGRTVTISFWAKVASGTPAISMNLVQSFGSGGSSDVGTAVTFTSTALSTGWQRFVGTATLPSVAGKTIGAGSYLLFPLQVVAGNNTLDVWGCQLESGSVATPFTTATGTLQGELNACMRYYWRNTSTGMILQMSGVASGSTNPAFWLSTPVTMRIAPTSVDFANLQAIDGVSGYALSGLTVNGISSPSVIYLNTTATGLTGFRPLGINASTGTGYLGFSAEL